MADILECEVERVTFRNEENGYTVIRCSAAGQKKPVTAVGIMPDVRPGSLLSLTGYWKTDPKYGPQFSVISSEETAPVSEKGIEKYLASGLVKGIGPGFAKKIVDAFGEDSLNVIDTEPEKLMDIPGIGKGTYKKIISGWNEHREIRKVMVFLKDHDVSTAHAVRIFRQYGQDSISAVTENPYRLADEIWGIGFRTADVIASSLGFGAERYERLRSGLIYAMGQFSDSGHCYSEMEELIKEGAELLGSDPELLREAVARMIAENDVIPEQAEDGGTRIYLKPFFFAENGTARLLMKLKLNGSGLKIGTEGLAERIEKKTGTVYDPVQKQAILTAVTNKVTVLTGGPGTGKTTTTLGIITAFREAGAKVLLAAPTGRAAKRLSEAAGMTAKTIHRLLEAKPPEGYARNESNRLTGDVLVVDECSMIDILLMYNLLKALPETMTLILVGDIDQLPSVGPGNVLRDIIASGCFPVVRLVHIFRQAQKSRIVTNAHRINEGKMPDLSNGHGTDFFFAESEDPEKAAELITELVRTRLPSHYGIRHSDIQVLTPMQKGHVGAMNLNRLLQDAVNPGTAGLSKSGVQYRRGDRVMQLRNNYEKEVFNGDVGTVTVSDPDSGAFEVDFDGIRVRYDQDELDEIMLAYAVTVHKSQGSEYPVVVMPVMMTHYVMLQRNLIYTGITRAKKVMVIVGTKKALAAAVHNFRVDRRNTLLSQRLKNYEAVYGNNTGQ